MITEPHNHCLIGKLTGFHRLFPVLMYQNLLEASGSLAHSRTIPSLLIFLDCDKPGLDPEFNLKNVVYKWLPQPPRHSFLKLGRQPNMAV